MWRAAAAWTTVLAVWNAAATVEILVPGACQSNLTGDLHCALRGVDCDGVPAVVHERFDFLSPAQANGSGCTCGNTVVGCCYGGGVGHHVCHGTFTAEQCPNHGQGWANGEWSWIPRSSVSDPTCEDKYNFQTHPDVANRRDNHQWMTEYGACFEADNATWMCAFSASDCGPSQTYFTYYQMAHETPPQPRPWADVDCNCTSVQTGACVGGSGASANTCAVDATYCTDGGTFANAAAALATHGTDCRACSPMPSASPPPSSSAGVTPTSSRSAAVSPTASITASRSAAPTPAAGWAGSKDVELSFTVADEPSAADKTSIGNQIAQTVGVPRSAVAITSRDVAKTYELRVIITGLSDSRATAAIAALDTAAELQAIVDSSGASGVAVQAVTSAPADTTPTGGGGNDDDEASDVGIIVGGVVGAAGCVAVAAACGFRQGKTAAFKSFFTSPFSHAPAPQPAGTPAAGVIDGL